MENPEGNPTTTLEQEGQIVEWMPGNTYRWPQGWTLTPLDEIVLAFSKDSLEYFYEEYYREPKHFAAMLTTSNQAGVVIRSDAERLLLCISPGVSVRIKNSMETSVVADDDTPRRIRIIIPGTPEPPKTAKTRQPTVLPEAIKTGSQEAESKVDREHRIVVVALFWGGGIILLAANWILALTMGMYSRTMAMLGPPLIVAGAYFTIYPNDDKVTPDKIPLRMWIMFALALVTGLANLYAFSHGWY